MTKRIILIGILFTLLIFTSYSTQLPSGFHSILLASGLQPTSLVKSPDGRIFITSKDGKVLIVKNGDFLTTPFITIPVALDGERGLHNIVFHPNFETNNYFYLFYSLPGETKNRLSRFTANGDKAEPGSEEVLFEIPHVGVVHHGGGLVFGNDNKLYLCTGDGTHGPNSQNLQALTGKVIRLNDDGTIPSDNPFYNQLQGNYKAIYASGLRNPFKAKINPSTGKIYLNEVGGGYL